MEKVQVRCKDIYKSTILQTPKKDPKPHSYIRCKVKTFFLYNSNC